ncbi:hypothetical protein BDK51DRAFT_32388, partial [Blyttiomyces helicus]
MSAPLEIDMSLLSPEEQKKPNFIRILQVLSTTPNHRGRVKDLQKLYENLPSNTNKIRIPLTVKAWNNLLETSQAGIVQDPSDSSCAFEGHHRICKGKNSSDGRILDYWVNTTLFPIFKTPDSGQNFESPSTGRYHPYSRRGSASSVVSSRSRQSSLSSTTESNANANEVLGTIHAQADPFIDRPMQTDEAATDSEPDSDSEPYSEPDSELLDPSTQDGYPLQETPPHSSITAALGATPSTPPSNPSTPSTPSTTPINLPLVTSTSPNICNTLYDTHAYTLTHAHAGTSPNIYHS